MTDPFKPEQVPQVTSSRGVPSNPATPRHFNSNSRSSTLGVGDPTRATHASRARSISLADRGGSTPRMPDHSMNSLTIGRQRAASRAMSPFKPPAGPPLFDSQTPYNRNTSTSGMASVKLSESATTFNPRQSAFADRGGQTPSRNFASPYPSLSLGPVREMPEPISRDSAIPTQTPTTTPDIRVTSTTSDQMHQGSELSQRVNINKEQRQQLREVRNEPSTPFKSKMVHAESIPLTEAEKTKYLPQLDYAIRWTTFLVHVDFSLSNIIILIFSDRNALHPSDFEWAVQKVTSDHQLFKNTVCNQAHDLVTELTAEDASLWNLSDDDFSTYLYDNFSVARYFSVFSFMKDFVNFEGSSEQGKWFMKGVYANLVVRARQFMAADDTNGWFQVLDFFDDIALVHAYDNVDMKDFEQLTEKFRKEKELHRRRHAATQARFILVSPVPPKTSTHMSFSDVRTGRKEDIEYLDALSPVGRIFLSSQDSDSDGSGRFSNATESAYHQGTPTPLQGSNEFGSKQIGTGHSLFDTSKFDISKFDTSKFDEPKEVGDEAKAEGELKQAKEVQGVEEAGLDQKEVGDEAKAEGELKQAKEVQGVEEVGLDQKEVEEEEVENDYGVPKIEWNDGGFFAMEDPQA